MRITEESVEVQTHSFSTSPAPALWVIKLSRMIPERKPFLFINSIESSMFSEYSQQLHSFPRDFDLSLAILN